MNLELEQLRLKLIETQMMLLQYQHQEVLARIAALQNQQNKQDNIDQPAP